MSITRIKLRTTPWFPSCYLNEATQYQSEVATTFSGLQSSSCPLIPELLHHMVSWEFCAPFTGLGESGCFSNTSLLYLLH